MYNKLFTKILDSSVWLESTTTRIVWLTFIAAMDEDGFAAFAAIGNLANRARVPLAACEQAVKVLEAPDTQSADPDHEGRRIERVPGGWLVLNAAKYRELVTRVVSQERTRERVRRHRAKTTSNATVTLGNDPVTPSEAYTEAETDTETQAKKIKTSRAKPALGVSDDFTAFYQRYPRHVDRAGALKAWNKIAPSAADVAAMHSALDWQTNQPDWQRERGKFIPYPATWLNGRRWEDEPFHRPADADDPNAEAFARVLGGQHGNRR